MWAWEEIDDRINDLCNIAFSEDFSFCISTPEHDEDEIFYKSSITSKRFPFLSDDLDTKGIPCSSPIMIKNTNQSVNSSKCLNFHKALIARKSTPYLGDGIFVNKRRKSFPIVIKNTKRYCVKASTPLNPHKALDRTRNYLETQPEDKIFHTSLITSGSSPHLSDGLDIKGMRKSPPILNQCRVFSMKLRKDLMIHTRNASATQEITVTLMKRDGLFGFTIDTFIGGLFIKALTRTHAILDGRICPGDRILQVNGRDISSFTLSETIIYLRNVPESVTLKICKCCSVWRFCQQHSFPKVQIFNVYLDKRPNEELGFTVWDSVKGSEIRKYHLPCVAEVETVYPGSIANAHEIKKGDRILEVNGDSFLGKTAVEVTDILQKTNGVMKMVFCRL